MDNGACITATPRQSCFCSPKEQVGLPESKWDLQRTSDVKTCPTLFLKNRNKKTRKAEWRKGKRRHHACIAL